MTRAPELTPCPSCGRPCEQHQSCLWCRLVWLDDELKVRSDVDRSAPFVAQPRIMNWFDYGLSKAEIAKLEVHGPIAFGDTEKEPTKPDFAALSAQQKALWRPNPKAAPDLPEQEKRTIAADRPGGWLQKPVVWVQDGVGPFGVVLPDRVARLAAILMRTTANDLRLELSPDNEITISLLLGDAKTIDQALADSSTWIAQDGERMAPSDIDPCCGQLEDCIRPCHMRQEHHERKAAQRDCPPPQPASLDQWITAFGHLSTLMPSLEIDIDNPERMAREIFDYVSQRMASSQTSDPMKRVEKVEHEDARDLLQTMDAMKWTEQFCARFDADPSDMIGWFANAIMTGYDHGYRRAKAETAEDENSAGRPGSATQTEVLRTHDGREMTAMIISHG